MLILNGTAEYKILKKSYKELKCYYNAFKAVLSDELNKWNGTLFGRVKTF